MKDYWWGVYVDMCLYGVCQLQMDADKEAREWKINGKKDVLVTKVEITPIHRGKKKCAGCQ